MNTPDAPPPDAADPRNFALAVWPQTAERPWQAEIRGPGEAAPVRFDRPLDLVLFLTELSRSPTWHPRGLR